VPAVQCELHGITAVSVTILSFLEKKNMISKEETQRVRRILEGIRDLASGRAEFDDLTQSTTEKIAVVLACDLPMPSFLINEKGWLGEAERIATTHSGHRQPEISGG
jgi:hypothetical protein